jgi:hypothetical protein
MPRRTSWTCRVARGVLARFQGHPSQPEQSTSCRRLFGAGSQAETVKELHGRRHLQRYLYLRTQPPGHVPRHRMESGDIGSRRADCGSAAAVIYFVALRRRCPAPGLFGSPGLAPSMGDEAGPSESYSLSLGNSGNIRLLVSVSVCRYGESRPVSHPLWGMKPSRRESIRVVHVETNCLTREREPKGSGRSQWGPLSLSLSLYGG